MRRLIHATDAEFADLARRSVGRCIRLLAAELPPGVAPSRGKVGVERDRYGSTTLYVQRHCIARGLPNRVRTWFDAGQLRFRTPTTMRQWLWHDLAPCYRPGALQRVATHSRIRTAVARVGAEFGVSCTDVDDDVIVHIGLCIDAMALSDAALQYAIRALLEPQLRPFARRRTCASVMIRLLSGLLIAWAIA